MLIFHYLFTLGSGPALAPWCECPGGGSHFLHGHRAVLGILSVDLDPGSSLPDLALRAVPSLLTRVMPSIFGNLNEFSSFRIRGLRWPAPNTSLLVSWRLTRSGRKLRVKRAPCPPRSAAMPGCWASSMERRSWLSQRCFSAMVWRLNRLSPLISSLKENHLCIIKTYKEKRKVDL